MNERRNGGSWRIGRNGHNVRVLGRIGQFWERSRNRGRTCAGLGAFAGRGAPGSA